MFISTVISLQALSFDIVRNQDDDDDASENVTEDVLSEDEADYVNVAKNDYINVNSVTENGTGR